MILNILTDALENFISRVASLESELSSMLTKHEDIKKKLEVSKYSLIASGQREHKLASAFFKSIF